MRPVPELGRRAAELLGAAGRRAFLRSDAPAGANLISRAVALLSPDDPLRVELVPNVRVAQGLDLTWAERVLTEAVEAAATTGDRRLAAHALVQRGYSGSSPTKRSRRPSFWISRSGRLPSSRVWATSSALPAP